jgi:hypothetical protein
MREKATNIEWLQRELESIGIDREYNREFKLYDCSEAYCTASEMDRNNNVYIETEKTLNRKEAQLQYFISRI